MNQEGKTMKTKKRILLVDDDQDILEQMTAILSAEGYEIAAAGNEKEAEEALSSAKPDLVVMDLMMNEKDAGFTLAHHLQSIYPGTPAILLTAVTSSTGLSFDLTSSEARSWLKVNKVMTKPVRAEQLRLEVRNLLKEKAAHH